MAQLCLYVEDELMDQIKTEAQRENLSLSGYVRQSLKNRNTSTNKWPQSFWDAFGAISDPTFVAPAELPAEDDAMRLSFD